MQMTILEYKRFVMSYITPGLVFFSDFLAHKPFSQLQIALHLFFGAPLFAVPVS